MADDVERVFNEWRDRRPRPSAVRLTKDRKTLIKRRLDLGYTADDLCLILRYMHDATTEDARWMRGANPRRRVYMDLEHLLRVQRLGERLEAATLWSEEATSEHTDSDPWRLV